MQSMDKEEQRNAIRAAIMTIHDGNVPDDTRITFTDVMNGMLDLILFPMTTTQLGVLSSYLDMRNLKVSGAINPRAKDFEEKLLDIFVVEERPTLSTKNDATINYDKIFQTDVMDQESFIRDWKRYFNRPEMIKKQRDMRNIFSDQLQTSEPVELSPNILNRVIQNHPNFVSRTTNTFNVLGAFGATYCIFREVFDENSGLREGNITDVFAVIATAVGGAGSFKATYDLAKVLGQKILQRFRPTKGPTKVYSVSYRAADEFVEIFEEEAVTELAVDLNNMERASSKLARITEGVKLERVFTALGVVADGIFLGISIYDLYKDFTDKNGVDSWKVADDFAMAASAGVGAALGKLE